tara:strand:+ start:900 stop:1154 length:255 start_codon:yes stop_codon:yes gene_type:complete
MKTDHLETPMTIYDVQPNESQVHPVVTNRVFHWEDLSINVRDMIRDLIDESIEKDISENLPAGSDILEAEVVVQVTIHTQVAEY